MWLIREIWRPCLCQRPQGTGQRVKAALPESGAPGAGTEGPETRTHKNETKGLGVRRQNPRG